MSWAIMTDRDSKWLDITKTGLPEEAIVTAAHRGELLVSDLGGSLFVEHVELKRWLQTKSIARKPPNAGLLLCEAAETAPNDKNYAAEWVVDETGTGSYMARVWLPDGTSWRIHMKDKYGCLLYTDKENDFGQAQDTAYGIAQRALQEHAVDSALKAAADDAAKRPSHKERPSKITKHWMAYVDGTGGEYAAKVRFRDNTSFLVQLHNRERKPLFMSRKLSKEQKRAMQDELRTIAETEYDLKW